MKRPLVVLVLALAVGALTSAGVSGAASSPLHGVFETTVKGKSSLLNGKWLISFAPNGAYAVVKEPATKTLLIGGVSKVSGHTVALTDKTGPLRCTGSQVNASYSWTISGKTLKLKPTKEACGGRGAVLGSAPFTRVG